MLNINPRRTVYIYWNILYIFLVQAVAARLFAHGDEAKPSIGQLAEQRCTKEGETNNPVTLLLVFACDYFATTKDYS